MKSLWTTLVAVGVLIGPLVTVVRADISADEVRKAIEEGIKYLERHQHTDGGWDEFQGYTGGTNALCTLALLNAGVKADDPADDHVARALDKLAKTPTTTTYARSLQTMVFCRANAANPAEYLPLIERNAEWLQKAQLTTGPRRGAWSYADPESAFATNGDNSNSQFALLALYEAQRAFDAAHAPIHVSDRTWRLAKAYWEGCQNLDGSWGYYKDQGGSGSMTLRGDQLADHRRRHGPPGRRQGRRRPHPVLWTRRRGKRPHRAGDHLAGQALHGDRQPRRAASVVALLSLRRGTHRAAHRPAVHRRPRLVPRGRRLLAPRAGSRERRKLEGDRPCRGPARDRHQPGPVVSFQGPPAGAAGQAPPRSGTGLEPASQRRGEPDRLRGDEMAARLDLAGDRPGRGVG